MKRIFSTLAFGAALYLTGNAAMSENDIKGVFVSPSDAYSPTCIKFCKDNEIGSVYMNYKEVKKGLAACYKDAGIKVICGWLPYNNMWNTSPREMDSFVKKWVNTELGENELKNIYGFEIDEPMIGYGDWKHEVFVDIEKDTQLKEIYFKNFNRQPFANRSLGTAAEWRNLQYLRQTLYWNKIKNIAAGFKNNYPEKSMTVTLSVAGYESGSSVGFDINLLNSILPEDINLTMDPYFQAFRRPLPWSGMMIKWFRNATDGRRIEGVIQFYDAVKHSGWPYEGYLPLKPDDVSRQTFEYLMNGATGISAFVMNPKIYTPESEHGKKLSESMDFVKKSEKYWKNTRPQSQAGIYFSENTFRMYDMWGPWSKMTGLYGASFQMEWTYYALSWLHVPADIISAAFNEDKGLPEKLRKYPVVILPDVKCISSYEAEAFKKYVADGGTVIVTGETSFYDENGKPLHLPRMAEIMGIKDFSKGQQTSLTFVQNSFLPQMTGKKLSFDGNPAQLFKQQATRQADWLKEKCMKMKYSGYDVKFPEKLPQLFSLQPEPVSSCTALAVYPDNSPAVLMNQFGKGKCIYIAPSDLTLFKGKVTDSLEKPESPDNGGVDFLKQLIDSCFAGRKLFEYSGCDGVETSLLCKNNSSQRYLFLLNHNGKPAENVKITLNIPADKIAGINLFDQSKACEEKLSYKTIEGKVELTIPPFKYGMIIEITETL
ncbi:MAG: beta-galactosidase trimerization domain-containing protein [Victivallaceae bacterium]|jgi:hypothetical protein